jgi:quercetin dioxygenase-like cupin family protein
MQYQRGRTEEPVLAGTDVGSTMGDVLLDRVIGDEGINVFSAMFKPCARTYWHHHERGQLFFVTGGKGMIATREGKQIVRAGDVVFTPPGEEHWHGAAPDAFVTYLAVSLGRTTFLDEVSDGDYRDRWLSD